jgi:prepilin-type N-terminal cleavage/methylation domain-containing protein
MRKRGGIFTSLRRSAKHGFTSSRRSAEHGFTSSRRSAEHGFTLIELLAAMVAGSLILATLSWTLATLGRELGAAKSAEPRNLVNAAAPILVGLIEQAYPTQKDEPTFVAGTREMEFMTTPPASLGAVGPVRATLSVRPANGGDALYASFAPADAGAYFPAAARQERLLAEGYRSIRFDYLLQDDKHKELPPRLVTIILADAKGRATRIAAAPRLTAGGDCRFDPVSMTCRR